MIKTTSEINNNKEAFSAKFCCEGSLLPSLENSKVIVDHNPPVVILPQAIAKSKILTNTGEAKRVAKKMKNHLIPPELSSDRNCMSGIAAVNSHEANIKPSSEMPNNRESR